MIIYTSIEKLPYHVCKQIMITGDRSLLVIEGKAREIDLSIAWEDILIQYGDALGQDDKDGYFMAYRDYLCAIRDKESAMEYIALLSQVYVKPWADKLNHIIDSDVEYNPADPELFGRQLEGAEARTRGLELLIRLTESKVNKLQKEREGITTIQTDRDYFATIENNIEEMVKYPIPWEKISTYDFCYKVVRYNNHIDYIKKNKKNERS